MQIQFLKKEGNSNLILIFGGWSTTPEFYADINLPDWDILVVTDYSDLEFPNDILKEYDTIYLFAWSLGVLAANKSLIESQITAAIAINGTLIPVDDNFGIPEVIYFGTLKNLDKRNLTKFRKRMAGSHYANVANLFPQDDNVENLRNQLEIIAGLCKISGTGNHPTIKWNRVYISENDRIFPQNNMISCWQSLSPETEIITLRDEEHLPDLGKIIRSVIISKQQIGVKFSKALTTYDDNAQAQKIIAERLASMAGQMKLDKILEIGPGTGYFSKLIAERLNPRHIDFIELFETSPLEIAENENYYISDAEKMAANLPSNSYDAIVSASTVQWFINPDLFFKNCQRLIKKNGFLLFSTFNKENLEELRSVNPYRILYQSADDLREILSKYFESILIEESNIKIDFESKRQLLHHLAATGVGAKTHSGFSIKELYDRLPSSLTYTPIFVLAQHPRKG